MTTLSKEQAIIIIRAASEEADTYAEECGDPAERSGTSTGAGIIASPIMDHFNLTWDDIFPNN